MSITSKQLLSFEQLSKYRVELICVFQNIIVLLKNACIINTEKTCKYRLVNCNVCQAETNRYVEFDGCTHTNGVVFDYVCFGCMIQIEDNNAECLFRRHVLYGLQLKYLENCKNNIFKTQFDIVPINGVMQKSAECECIYCTMCLELIGTGGIFDTDIFCDKKNYKRERLFVCISCCNQLRRESLVHFLRPQPFFNTGHNLQRRKQQMTGAYYFPFSAKSKAIDLYEQNLQIAVLLKRKQLNVLTKQTKRIKLYDWCLCDGCMREKWLSSIIWRYKKWEHMERETFYTVFKDANNQQSLDFCLDCIERFKKGKFLKGAFVWAAYVSDTIARNKVDANFEISRDSSNAESADFFKQVEGRLRRHWKIVKKIENNQTVHMTITSNGTNKLTFTIFLNGSDSKLGQTIYLS